jgi:hypothetical protein
MMELRQAGKEEMQGDEQSAKNANTGVTFSKSQQMFLLGATVYNVKLTENS